ncbi:ATP-grasp domain-containing protein [Hespellia stercorisuis]|uniref:Biotin carboxylase n=1 Tax=Hespellia stercorisuis DSM 15480 TaxID=1121950 RepID=A0A1M6V2G3_9FIRM|nr:ATP-grasp domain-containing protein [Hespellia stercorisuis]SHK75545.1 Biotin carboxylase [Hespellia stercorisuis DSM 15480]
MKKIVIIGANSFQNPLIVRAKEMGYETHVFAWQDGSVGERTADVFYPISIIEKEKILEECRKINPCAVVTIASDLAAITANYIANALGLPANSEACVKKSTNKYLMRQSFNKAGVSVPRFIKVSLADFEKQAEGLTYPLIVKPTDRSGSRSITEVADKTKLRAAVERAVGDSFEKKAIVEEYIDGEEYSFESISYQGKHTRLAVTKKYTTGRPHYIENGHIEPSGLSDEVLERVTTEIFRALDALEIENGASHAEFRINGKGKIGIIEIGARMGGDCIGSDLVRISTGYDYVRMVIQTALGMRPDFSRVQEPKIAWIRFLMTRNEVINFQKIRETFAEKISFVSEIDKSEHEVIDSSSRLGYFIMALDCVDEVEEVTDLVETE